MSESSRSVEQGEVSDVREAGSEASEFVALDFPIWIRWGQRRGAFMDMEACRVVYPDVRYWTREGYCGETKRCAWCGGVLSGRRTSWCSDGCSTKFYRVWSWRTLTNYVYERDGGICQRCGTNDPGKPVGNRYSAWEVDHIHRVVDGGTDDPANLRLLCAACHVAVGYEQRAAKTASRSRSSGGKP